MELADVGQAAREGNVALVHDETADRHGDGWAVEADGTVLTHGDLRDRSAAFAGGLADLGFEPGSRLLVYLPNCPEFVIGSLGGVKAGVVVSPANPQYRVRELAYQLEDADAHGVLTHAELADVVRDTLAETGRDPVVVSVGEPVEGWIGFEEVDGSGRVVERSDADVALLPYTSGTTGRPKGVRLTHDNLRAQLFASLASSTDALAGEEVKSLVWLPLYHITGFVHTTFQPLVRGGCVYLRRPGAWDPAVAMRVIEDEGITHFIGVTAMYVDMVTSDAFGASDLSGLVAASEGGAKMSVAVQREFEAEAGIRMTEGYGLTETTGATHTQQGASHGPRHGTVGQPLRTTDSKIVDEDGREVPVGDEGELLVRGPQVMDGYHDRPDETARAFTRAGYFRTGDVARRDALNYYEIVDRKKHVIVSAGYNIYPSEVEAVLEEHGAVAEAAVVGVPDDRRNEVPIAYVVLREAADASITPADLREYCLETIAPYKHPREVRFVDELPRTASGKVRKFVLRDRHTPEHEARG